MNLLEKFQELKVTSQELYEYGISSLRDAPNRVGGFGANGFSAEELKQAFDKLPTLISEKFNEAIDELTGWIDDILEFLGVEINNDSIEFGGGIKVYYETIGDFFAALLNGEWASAAMVVIKGETITLNKLAEIAVKFDDEGYFTVKEATANSHPVPLHQLQRLLQKSFEDACASSNAFAKRLLAELVGTAPENLDTIHELAIALQTLGVMYNPATKSFHVGEAEARGEGSVAFGGKRYDDKDNPERRTCVAKGKQSFVANAGNHANGPWSSAFGKETEANGGGSDSRGGGTEAGVSYEFFLKFFGLEDNDVNATRYAAALERSNTTLHTTFDKAGYKYWFASASGEATKAYARASNAQNLWTEAWGDASSAKGAFTKAIGFAASAEGGRTYLNGTAEDEADESKRTIARGDFSHAENKWTHADAEGSHTEGWGTIAKKAFQHVQGQFNVPDNEGKFAHIVGWGANDRNRRNIHTLDTDGNAYFAGDVTTPKGKLVTERRAAEIISPIAKRVANLEAGIGPDWYITDGAAAYVKVVPDGVGPFAEIEMLGGATERRAINYFNVEALKNDGGDLGMLRYSSQHGGSVYFSPYPSTPEFSKTLFATLCPEAEIGKTYVFSYAQDGTLSGGVDYDTPGDYVLSLPKVYIHNSIKMNEPFVLTESIRQSALSFGPGDLIQVYPDGTTQWYSVVGDTFYNFALYAVDMVPAEYTPYGEGARLINAAVTAVVSRDATGNEIGRIDIPAEMQALEGYGKGIPDGAYNSIEVDDEGNAVFINRLSCRLGSWNVSYYDPIGETLIATGAADGSAVNIGVERVLCNKFPFADGSQVNKGQPRIYKSGRGINIFPGKEYTAETWAAQLAAWEAEGDPLVIWYERADPVVTKLEAFDNLIAVRVGGTLAFENESNMPAASKVIYHKKTS